MVFFPIVIYYKRNEGADYFSEHAVNSIFTLVSELLQPFVYRSAWLVRKPNSEIIISKYFHWPPNCMYPTFEFIG